MFTLHFSQCPLSLCLISIYHKYLQYKICTKTRNRMFALAISVVKNRDIIFLKPYINVLILITDTFLSKILELRYRFRKSEYFYFGSFSNINNQLFKVSQPLVYLYSYFWVGFPLIFEIFMLNT